MRFQSFCTHSLRLLNLPRLSLCGLSLILLTLPTSLVAASQPAAPGLSEVSFRVVAGHALVSVTIDGAGPFDFILDNGCQTSIVDPELAQTLALPILSHETLVSVSRSTSVNIAEVREIRLGDATASHLKVMVDPLRRAKSAMPTVRGLLGEDFLQQFDFMLDNHDQKLLFEQQPGTLLSTLDGVRLPLQKSISPTGHPAYTQLVVAARSPQLGDKSLALQLDSGADTAFLFAQEGTTSLLLRSSTSGITIGEEGAQRARLLHLPSLWIAKVNLTDVPLAILDKPEMAPEIDGALPTAAFHRIYFSHSSGFVILNPSKSRHPTPPTPQPEPTPTPTVAALNHSL